MFNIIKQIIIALKSESSLMKLNIISSPLKKQLIKFTLVGILAAFVDLSVYSLMLFVYPEKLFGLIPNVVMAKTTSFLAGLTVTYYFNKRWTWRKKDKSSIRLLKFSLLYGFSLIMNVSTNSILLYILYHNPILANLPFKYLIAFCGASGMSALVNFTGQRFWVFKAHLEAVSL